ncbi:LEAF RUST 10 DISEASE-RESISTANCE LOCUS RECEPTOR-LIKE PROTEIN KINASE-like 1.3 [Citrus sinensis]|uniref:LEAF RUST 10 DISEASE-RESISTANCE LOCUS RECEPTOR-LIKE PROTEIN KINASE-like 1.3 n=1 Tax=Citrus sinensis TaxID=2711 RepID=UPI0022787DBE|nr:LEAF RUST 10 DISEASE-RESISTANCE LOCUS RECEPTOR-LIKE PROTEIN KINASE-like 1.3 [Citrus sinensis]
MGFQFSLPGLPLISLLCFLSVLVVDKIQPSLANPELCSIPFGCGKLKAGYPFWGGIRPELCGHPSFELKCENETPTMKLADVTYRVLNVNTKEKVIKLARQEYFEGLCPQSNTIIDTSLFDISDGYEMFNLIYSCPMYPGSFTCNMKDDTNLYIKLEPSEGAQVEELNQEPTVSQPKEDIHHQPVQENQRPKRIKKLPDWLRDYVV